MSLRALFLPASAAVFACTVLSAPAAPLGAAAPPAIGVADRVFTDSNSPVVVRAGQLFVIVLDTNPSTGYHWVSTGDPEGGVATLRGTTFLPGSSDMMGAPGKELRIYEAVGPGSGSIGLSYMPPGSGGSAAKHLNFKLTVIPADAAG